jgi:hypothetical protein
MREGPTNDRGDTLEGMAYGAGGQPRPRPLGLGTAGPGGADHASAGRRTHDDLAHAGGAYLEGGLDHAVADVQRPGKPRRYRTEVEAQITALACSAPPTGAKRWTMLLLERAARAQPGMKQISRETIRRLLKKTVSNRGAG